MRYTLRGSDDRERRDATLIGTRCRLFKKVQVQGGEEVRSETY